MSGVLSEAVGVASGGIPAAMSADGLAEHTYDEATVARAAAIMREVMRDKGYVCDHINGWRLDNRRANLRLVTTAENAQNQGSRGGSSRFRGVTWDKSRQKWMATGMLDGKRKTLGRFDDEVEAAACAAGWRAGSMPFSMEAVA